MQWAWSVLCVRCLACGRVLAVSLTLFFACLRVYISLLLLPPLLRAGTVVASRGYGGSAVCAEHPMAEGAHYVEMTLLEKGRFGPMMGVVGQGFDAAGGGQAASSAEGWMLSTNDGGALVHAGSAIFWQGKPQRGEIKQGDVVGLLLDVGQRTLS